MSWLNLLSGKGMGAKPDSPDPRDKLYGAAAPIAALPPFVDLRKKLPPVWDQGETNACGGMSGAALMSFLFPGYTFSALDIYYKCRVLEGDVEADNGVEPRNVLKILQQQGALIDPAWMFDASKVGIAPRAGAVKKIGSYSRLTSAQDFLSCLAKGSPFTLGFKIPKSLDGDAIAQSGIMQTPDLKQDPIVGAHDVLVVGYDKTFKQTPFFEASGIDASKVDDTMLLIRNSWGPKWSPKFRGHFWMPLSYAVNASTGGDAWTASFDPAQAEASDPVQTPVKPAGPTQAQLDAGFRACRTAIDATGYGGWVSDDKLRPVSDSVTYAVVAAR